MNQRPTEQELQKKYKEYCDWRMKHENTWAYTFEDWIKEIYNFRLLVLADPNTNQFWIYDEVFDVYIDPPKSIVKAYPIHVRDEEYDKNKEEIDKLIEMDPDWLYDREYWYKDLDTLERWEG